jgi:zinc transporter ZupT
MGDHVHVDDDAKPDKEEGTLATPLFLLAALCVHGSLEGIAFGIQDTESAALSLLIAILAHKPVETLTLGTIMVREKISRWNYFMLTLLLSLITPIGITIGLAVNNLEIPPLLMGSLTALAVGSFFYLSTTEIIADEFHRHTMTKTDKLKRYISFLGGVLFILLLEIGFGGHNHDH